MLVAVTVLLFAGLMIGLMAWLHVRRERAAADSTAALFSLLDTWQKRQLEAQHDAHTAYVEAMKSLAVTVVNPPEPATSLSEHEVARELYEQGIIPAYNDPSDDSDPTDTDQWLTVDREDVANASADDAAPFGIPGVPYSGPRYATNVVQFPPPSA